ncbi:transient receptor potential Ca2 channel (TRP-CC) family protein [Phytophthora cinnamomi]|uniref:transient receptor potential Ca2 channel (TRP-CC) family protein n=1 Tax=Phytophthora cinnamomi TaxID=4785 RepID=UPI00355ABCAF|nr:transient receptor potential Ca2 channel (TRP-CC) family protein [Phytophthora cinnamomi]
MYEGMSTPQGDKMTSLRPRMSDSEAKTLSNESRQSAGGHGAPREDDQEDAQRIPMIPLMGQGTAKSVASSVVSRLSVGSHLSLNQLGTSSQLRRRPPTSMSSKKRSFYHGANGAVKLRGKMPHVPRHWLNARFRHNTFFARRLLHTGLPLALVLATGLGFYYFYKPDWLVLNEPLAPDEYGFMLHSPSLVYTFQASSCENVVGFSALIYHTLPAVILLCLPGSGWRLFEPFKREEESTPSAGAPGAQLDKTDVEAGNGGMDLDDDEEDNGNLTKIKRRLVFQFCELVAVLLLLFQAVVVMFFLYMFFKGGVFSCDIHAVQLFAIVSIVCFVWIFTELQYFARFREHVKMLLGAFQESDQTGDVRNHVMDPGVDQLMNQSDKALAVVRKRLYKATRQGDLREMRDILDYAEAAGLTSFVQQLYCELTDSGIMCFGDRNVEGQDFEDRIHAAQEAIIHCTCFIVILSKQTMNNELVRDQLAFAEDKGRPIFPIALNDLDPGLDKRYSLARNELFHFMGNGMSFKPSADRLVQGLRRHYTARDENLGTMLDNGTRIASANTSFVSFTFENEAAVDHDHEASGEPMIQEGAVLRESSDSSEPDPSTVTRNFESISGIEDAQLDLSSTHVRM